MSQLILIGEAVGRLSDEFKNDRDEIPWRAIAAMRNRLIHQYDTINWSLVWETATGDVPELLVELEPLISTDDAVDASDG